ncbi:hypothetical protein [Xanthomonas theicola]|uniref:hypothetical protein n=1 Tax=Xanthomonas theicola TaxID=56464 RepID=UPI001304C51E|nr:hypothetical protein [Xanthomonas theicola]
MVRSDPTTASRPQIGRRSDAALGSSASTASWSSDGATFYSSRSVPTSEWAFSSAAMRGSLHRAAMFCTEFGIGLAVVQLLADCTELLRERFVHVHERLTFRRCDRGARQRHPASDRSTPSSLPLRDWWCESSRL